MPFSHFGYFKDFLSMFVVASAWLESLMITTSSVLSLMISFSVCATLIIAVVKANGRGPPDQMMLLFLASSMQFFYVLAAALTLSYWPAVSLALLTSHIDKSS